MTEMSRSPYRMMARVLGMGVALMTIIWGKLPLLPRSSLWATPNRCCSSVITRANRS